MSEPQVKAQLVVSLLDNNTTNLTYTHDDEILNRGLLDKARSILDLQCLQKMQEARSMIEVPKNGDVRRIIR